MKSSLLFLVCLVLLTACAPHKGLMGNRCQENTQFKKTYFHHIAIIEAWTLGAGKAPLTIDRDAVIESLNFVGKYSRVSMNKLVNYHFGYPNQATYEEDKAGWLKWYEANKCANLH